MSNSNVYIVSTMTNSVSYRTYLTIGNPNPEKGPRIVTPINEKTITIKGGANRPSQKTGFGDQQTDINGNMLWTARGVVTSISEEDYERLKDHWLFKKHLLKGLVEVVNRNIEGNYAAVKAIVANMTPADNQALLTKETIAQRIKVKTPSKELAQEWQ
jgi:hypothetical protein